MIRHFWKFLKSHRGGSHVFLNNTNKQEKGPSQFSRWCIIPAESGCLRRLKNMHLEGTSFEGLENLNIFPWALSCPQISLWDLRKIRMDFLGVQVVVQRHQGLLVINTENRGTWNNGITKLKPVTSWTNIVEADFYWQQSLRLPEPSQWLSPAVSEERHWTRHVVL